VSAQLALPPVLDARQVHGCDVMTATGAIDAHGDDLDWASPHDHRPDADAIVVPPGVAVAAAVLVADCVPLALALGDAFAVVHAGWRGAADGVVEAALAELLASAPEGGHASDVDAFLGPAIGPCCFEVGPEVGERFDPADVLAMAGANPHVDLPEAVERALREAGVERVERAGTCTVCDPLRRWHSHRRDGEQAGRTALVAWREGDAPHRPRHRHVLQGR
jgi:YfiH family protein